MTRAARRHPATAAAADLAEWERRWPATATEAENILAVRRWLLHTAKDQPARPAKATPVKAPTLPKPKAAAKARRPDTTFPPIAEPRVLRRVARPIKTDADIQARHVIQNPQATEEND